MSHETGQKLTQEQITPLYEKAFVHINLNTGAAPEILLIPRVAKRMTREFEEYRPWVSMTQFDKEIGKYFGAAETNRLKQYVFIPLDLNTATDEQFKTIPNLGGNMLRELKEYRPWKTKAQFDKEIGKYVGPKETARLWRFMTIKQKARGTHEAHRYRRVCRSSYINVSARRHVHLLRPVSGTKKGRSRVTRNLDRFPIRRDGDAVVVNVTQVFKSDQDAAGWNNAAFTV